VSHDLYIRKPQVSDNDIPWEGELGCNTDGVVKGDGIPLYFPEET